MTDEAKRCVEWMNAYIKTESCHKVHMNDMVFGDYGEDWMWLDDICKQAADLIESLSAELEQVKAERDTAVKQLKEVDAEGLYCSHCKHDALCEGPILLGCGSCERESCPCHTCEDSSNWQWCGVQENGVGADNETR